MTTSEVSAGALPAGVCADCGGETTADPRFVRWCTACGWNARPGVTAARTRRDRFDRRLNRAAEEALHRRVSAAPEARFGRGAAWFGAMALAGLVHLLTVALLLAAVLLLSTPSVINRAVGAFLLLLAWVLRPRLGSVRKARRTTPHVERGEAPGLYALADRIAAELGTAPVALICFDDRYNASYRRVGFRRLPVLTIGLPLWEVLGTEQRVALLGHEFGHGAAGDAARGLWIGTALASLRGWYSLLVPGGRRVGRTRHGGPTALGESIARVVLAVFAQATLLVHRLLRRLTALATREAEYRADRLAARVAGTAATAGLLRALTLGSSAEHVRSLHRLRTASAGPRPARGAATAAPEPPADFWTELREYVASIPETERARRLRVCQLDDSATDASHPPTHLRIAFVEQLPAAVGTVAWPEDEKAAVEATLAPVRAAVAEQLC